MVEPLEAVCQEQPNCPTATNCPTAQRLPPHCSCSTAWARSHSCPQQKGLSMDRKKNKIDREKEEEFLVQNTPPTPESPSTVAVADCGNHQSTATVSGSLPPNQEEIQSIANERDGTAEAQNTAEHIQDLQSERNISSKSFDASVSSSSGNQSEPEHAENVFRGQKNLQNAQGRDSSSKKQKTSLKTSVNIKKKNKSRKCGQSGESESDLKEHDNHLPKGCKWSFQVSDLQNLSSTERITVLQEKMQEIRKRYLLLKAELAAIDRTKRLKKKKEQERAAATSSSSSNGMPEECR